VNAASLHPGYDVYGIQSGGASSKPLNSKPGATVGIMVNAVWPLV